MLVQIEDVKLLCEEASSNRKKIQRRAMINGDLNRTGRLPYVYLLTKTNRQEEDAKEVTTYADTRAWEILLGKVEIETSVGGFISKAEPRKGSLRQAYEKLPFSII